MSAKRRLERASEDRRPVVTDDFIYDDPIQPQSGSETDSAYSDTPEEAIRKLKGSSSRDTRSDNNDLSGLAEDRPQESDEGSGKQNKKHSFFRRKKSGERRSHPVIRGFILVLITLSLILAAAAYIFNHSMENSPQILSVPENTISSAVTPVQGFFSGLTETIFGYFRTLKLRSNIETAYNELVAENEELAYKAMRVDQLEQELSMYRDIQDEMLANQDLQPLFCNIIGKSDSNYFSTFTINKGWKDGVQKYCAVVSGGGLVGYTESVEYSTSTVRTIIDSTASIAAVIDSTRDQGNVKGTLGIDETPICRMYYMSTKKLPRPGDLVVTSGVAMDFIREIPIGTVTASTRGMQEKNQYIEITPIVDFSHLEAVIVFRYKPDYAEPIERRENADANIELVPLETARPSPRVPEVASVYKSQDDDELDYDTGEGDEDEEPEEETPSPTPDQTPTPTPVPTPSPSPTPDHTSFVYHSVNTFSEPTPTPTPSPVPTATPYITPDPDDMTFDEED
ncbi:rod shape-determining protein MreC [Aristaeella lactis]|uniref:Rod shape-determining protein MreC n=1 Tax=Aristaeella lactis TaxID=3046383 RepID=A0AC61PIP6_9FIRM|nr:rod shape-determining protein MreC [Aristaeella lactis]QUA53885.1 rod shape-determining protein MreC [Aristaeella lactis]SMC40471.1 rod shape-determining protein MreC [Aristaeella lactis]